MSLPEERIQIRPWHGLANNAALHNLVLTMINRHGVGGHGALHIEPRGTADAEVWDSVAGGCPAPRIWERLDGEWGGSPVRQLRAGAWGVERARRASGKTPPPGDRIRHHAAHPEVPAGHPEPLREPNESTLPACLAQQIKRGGASPNNEPPQNS